MDVLPHCASELQQLINICRAASSKKIYMQLHPRRTVRARCPFCGETEASFARTKNSPNCASRLGWPLAPRGKPWRAKPITTTQTLAVLGQKFSVFVTEGADFSPAGSQYKMPGFSYFAEKLESQAYPEQANLKK